MSVPLKFLPCPRCGLGCPLKVTRVEVDPTTHYIAPKSDLYLCQHCGSQVELDRALLVK